MIAKLLTAYREGGFSEASLRLLSYCYRTIRPILPNHGHYCYAGVPVERRKLGDELFQVAHAHRDEPGYEQALVSALRAHVRTGDDIVIVGVGMGVTCVVAAMKSEIGHVECFEGNSEGLEKLIRVARLNQVSDRIKAHHAVVGKAISVYGAESSLATAVIRANELPPCDFLELDCEGAEMLILREMTIQPRVIAVETHGFLGAPTDEVRRLLEARGYQVEDLGWAEPRYLEACAKNDIKVLVGVLGI
ncbi:FkbM family methyltransferase [Bradyrhizobium sp. B117]|uniref:FkbM family methyltransferase n=1 Tax=Bradyrhizobium sp. B117 TaxID=3140246 RepID=UPI0031834AD7